VRESYDFPGLSIDAVTSSDTSTGNGNGAIDPNECVEIFVRLRNPSVTNATAITGVLTTTTPGVTVVQGTSAYPNLPADGTAFNLTPFRIYTSPDFVCGTRIELILLATGSSPGTQTTTNAFVLRSGFVSLNPILLNNNAPVSIPDANTNGVESAINVAGMSGALGKVTVSVHVTHPAVGDLVLELIGPDGTVVALAKNQGANGDNFGTACTPLSSRTTFDDNAPFEISVANPPYAGTFRPDEPLDVFEGKSAGALNGTWRLRVIDSGANDVGTLQCWTLSLFPTVCTNGGGACASDIAVSAIATPAPAYGNIDLTYAVTVTNMRPIAAMGVTVTNVLPAGVTFVSASSSQGTCTFIGGTVRCNLGMLAGGATASVSIVVQPTLLGSLTNVFTAGASADSNLTNNSVSVVSTVVEALPQFVANGAQVMTESFTPATGGIEAGETVTVNLALRNIGPIASGNLIATLLEGNGVSASSGSQSYGAITPGASGIGSFQFTASGVAGTTISAVLALQDGARNLGTVSFQFTAGGEVLVENITPITINTLGSASPYPSTLNVSGAQNVISKVRVTFTKLSHTFPDDIDAMLVGPRGQKVVLMSDAGGSSALINRTITFDDAAGLLPNESNIAPGSYQPTDFNSGTEPGGDVFPAPAPVGARSSSLGAFNGTDPNGTWSLFIQDDGGNDNGSVSGGWSLLINTVAPVNPVADLQITSLVSPAPIAGEPFTITLTVFNNGPSNATSVVVNDALPTGMEAGSASVSQGTVSLNLIDGTLAANLGTISNGASATITVQLQPNSLGLRSNVATVSAASVDLNSGNNVATSTFTVAPPASDLGLRVTAAPSPLFVSSNITFIATITNAGPNHAEAVRLTNRLSAGLGFVSVTNSQGSCSFTDGILTCGLGDINPNGTATVVLHATAISPGTVTNLFALNSYFADAAPANNATNVVTVISPISPVIVASGVALTAENPGPANGSLDSGESVSISFGLRNAGTAPTANLVATLLPGGGVSSPSAPQNYGVLEADGATVARPFSFVVAGAAGSVLTATLQLQDGAQDLGTLTFNFSVSASRSFTNNNVIIIPNQGVANTYPSTLAVSGIAGSVSKVTVNIRQLTHSFPEDIDVLLVSPSGQKVMLMSDAGAGNSINNVNLTLDDSSGPLPFSTAIGSGTYRPTDYAPGETLPVPAPVGPYSTNLATFNGANPNGVWALYVVDDAAGDPGRIDGGWALNIQTAAPVASSADLAVTATAPAATQSGELISYSITVANHGPAAATGVTLNDALPPSFALASVVVSQGSYSTSPASVTANLGTLNAGASAVVTISGSASGPRTLTNVLSVLSAQNDPNAANNTAVVTTFVSTPLLSIQRAGANAIITWRSSAAGYVLESSTNASGAWAAAGLSVVGADGTNTVTVPAVGTKFYRLRK
jgi:uncharacterized repeat protein (TIGR01451 family)